MNLPLIISSKNSAFSLLPIHADSVIRRFRGHYHMHNYTEVWYVFRGEMKHMVENREFIQTAGTLMIVPSYTAHYTDTSNSEDTPVIFSATGSERELLLRGYDCFLRHRSVSMFEGRQLPLFRTLENGRRAEADKLAHAMLDEDFKKYPESPDVRCRLFADFLRNASEDMPKLKISRALRERTDAINAAADFISEHYREKISLDKLSENAIMSKRRFTENFKTVTGLTTVEMTMLYRFFYAEQLLVFSDKTLTEIAFELGFYDKSSFSHAFSAHFGIAPIAFRKKNREHSYQTERSESLKRKRRYETLNYYYVLKHGEGELPKTYVTHMPGLI